MMDWSSEDWSMCCRKNIMWQESFQLTGRKMQSSKELWRIPPTKPSMVRLKMCGPGEKKYLQENN